MRKILAVLLIFTLLLGLAGCAHENQPESSVLESSQAESSAESLVSEQVSPAPVDTPEKSDSTYPVKEPVYHDWDGSDTLYPYAVIAYPGIAEPFGFEQGMLLTSESYLHYLDFASGQLVKFCFRPNCQHNTADCNAKTSNRSSSFVANNKFYFLNTGNIRSEYDEELEVYVGEIDLYVSALNGADEKKVTSLRMDVMPSAPSWTRFQQLVLYGNSAFLFYNLVRKSYADGVNDSPEDSYGHSYVTEIDLKTDKVVRTVILSTGYNPGAFAACAYNGGIYLREYVSDEPFPEYDIVTAGEEWRYIAEGVEYSPEEFDRYKDELIREEYFRYDIRTGELERRTDGFPDEYGGPLADYIAGVYDFMTQGIIPRAMVKDWCIVNDGDMKAYNLKTGEVQTIVENAPLNAFDLGVVALPNSNKIALYVSGEDISVLDLDTGERSEIPYLSDGQYYIRVGKIYSWTDDTLYADGARLEKKDDPGGELVYLRIDLTNGFEANQWEEFTLS